MGKIATSCFQKLMKWLKQIYFLDRKLTLEKRLIFGTLYVWIEAIRQEKSDFKKSDTRIEEST